MMKRIAALTALAITLLAVPATAAMASTSGSGPGYAKPRPVQLVCPRVHRFHRGYVIRHHKRIGVRIRIACPTPARPHPRQGPPRPIPHMTAAIMQLQGCVGY